MPISSIASLETECSSFEIIDRQDLEDYQGVGVLYRHKRTGMEVFHIVNSDSELFAGFIFKTLPESSNGVAHILEHTVLSGSSKFPVKDPFMAVCAGSANTFMNALTYPGCTFYPFASILKKDFDNIFEVYSDAVFSPLLRKESFLMEGIRQEGNHFDGVVFNEMKGNCSDQSSIVSAFSQMGLFKGTPYGFDSGGSILEIPQLTYEEYLETYQRWYNPGNCRLFLYGDLNANEYLNFLDVNYLKDSEIVENKNRLSTEIPFSEPFLLSVPGPPTKDSSVVLSWATLPESDSLGMISLSVLVDVLLGDPGNPLYRAISESDLGEDLSDESGMGVGFRFMPFVVGFSGADKNNAQKIEKFILKSLRDICDAGLDPKLIEASLKAEEFSLQEVQRNFYPIGYYASQRAMRGWLDGQGPFESVRTTRKIRLLRQALEKDPKYFEHWIEKNLLDNPHRMLLVVYPDEDYEKNQETLISSYLKPQTEDQLKVQKQLLDHFNNTEDRPEDLAKIGHLKREDLGDRFLQFEYRQMMISNQKVFIQNMFANGICYFTLSFNTIDLSREEHLLMPLLIRLIWMTGVGELDYSQVAIQLKELTSSAMMVPTCSTTLDNRSISSATAIIKTLRRDSSRALVFIARLLREGDLSSTERIKAALTDLLSDFKANFIEVAHSFALRRATSGFSLSLMEQELVAGISQWEFLESLSKKPLPDLSSKLIALREKLCDRRRLMSQIGCDEQSTQDCLNAVEAFGSEFEDKGQEIKADLTGMQNQVFPEEESFIVPGQVAYNAMAIPLEKQSEDDRVGKLVLSAILSDYGLWERIRGKGGAYMAETRMGMYNDFFYFSTYRDPRISETFDDFLLCLEDLINNPIDPKTLETEIISLVGRELRPRSPMDICSEGRKRFVLGLSEELYHSRINRILKVTPEDIKLQAEKLLARAKIKRIKVSIASRNLLKKNGIDVSKSEKLMF